MKYVFIEYAQANLQKCIIWPKNLGKENMIRIKHVLKLEFTRKLNTLVKTR